MTLQELRALISERDHYAALDQEMTAWPPMTQLILSSGKHIEAPGEAKPLLQAAIDQTVIFTRQHLADLDAIIDRLKP